MRALFLLLAISLCCQAQDIQAITNSASYTGRISPGGLATLFGTNLANSTDQASSLPLPASLGGTTITINGFTCPLLYVSATQINFQVPFEIAPGNASLTLTATLGFQTINVQVTEAAPALFQYGTNLSLAVDYTTGAVNAGTAPVASGDYLIVYLTGIGPVSATPADGAGAGDNPVSSATDSFTATIGGVNANVAFLGLVPGLVGLAQANVQVPSLANGSYPLVITVNGITSTSAVVSVSGTGTVQPDVLTYLSSVGVPTQALQSNVHGAIRVQVNGQYAYVCSASQITAIDVSNPLVPIAVSAFGQAQLNGQGTNCLISNSYLVEVVNGGSYVVWDLLTSPTAPQQVAGPTGLQIPLAGHLAFDGSTLFFDTSQAFWSTATGDILSESGSLEAYNFTNFTAPVFDSVYNPPPNFTQDTSQRFQMAALNSQYLAMVGTTNFGGSPTSGQGVIDVLDVSNPANIQGVVEVAIPQAVVLQDIALNGTEALIQGNTQAWNNPIIQSGNGGEFLNAGDLTLSVVDFTNPANPSVLGTTVTGISSAHEPYMVSLGGGFFALSNVESYTDYNGAGALAVVDARDPSSINWIPVATLDGGSGMYVQGSYLYLATGGGVNIYQIALPPANGAPQRK